MNQLVHRSSINSKILHSEKKKSVIIIQFISIYDFFARQKLIYCLVPHPNFCWKNVYNFVANVCLLFFHLHQVFSSLHIMWNFLKQFNPRSSVCVWEKSSRVLRPVRVWPKQKINEVFCNSRLTEERTIWRLEWGQYREGNKQKQLRSLFG